MYKPLNLKKVIQHVEQNRHLEQIREIDAYYNDIPCRGKLVVDNEDGHVRFIADYQKWLDFFNTIHTHKVICICKDCIKKNKTKQMDMYI